MHILWYIPFFASSVLALVAPAVITAAAQLAKRQAAENICGYYSLNGLINTISCTIGTPCLIATAVTPAVGYCSGVDNTPVTTIYAYGNCPIGGPEPGGACCQSAEPAWGKYLFNEGNTVFLGCGPTPFAYTAFFSDEAGFSTPASAPVTDGSAIHTTSTAPGIITTSPVSLSTTTPAPSSGSGSGTSTTAIVIIIVGAVVALIGFIVLLVFLYKVWKIHRAKDGPQWPNYIGLPNPSNSRGGLSKWAKVATIVSCFLGVVGLAVAIYFGLEPRNS